MCWHNRGMHQCRILLIMNRGIHVVLILSCKTIYLKLHVHNCMIIIIGPIAISFYDGKKETQHEHLTLDKW